MASSVLFTTLLLVSSADLGFFGSGEVLSDTENVCGRGYYAKAFPIVKQTVKDKRTAAIKGKYVCRKCGRCMDGLQTVKSCNSWADTQCGRCEHEDLGFVFDMTTKSCQHPYVMSGKIPPEDIWKILGVGPLHTTTESTDNQLAPIRSNSISLIRPTDELPLYPRTIEFKATTKTFTESLESSVFALSFFGCSIILSLSLIGLIILSCKLKAAQDGVNTLFPCFIYSLLTRIDCCCTRERTHTAAVAISIADEPKTSSYREKPGNVMQLSKDSAFPETTSLYQIRTNSLPVFLPHKSSSCHDFGYDCPHDYRYFALSTLPCSTPTRDSVYFYIGDGNFKDVYGDAQNLIGFQSLNLTHDSIDSEYASHDTCCDVSKSDVSSVATEDEYGAWRAFIADARHGSLETYERYEHHDARIQTEVYLPSITTL